MPEGKFAAEHVVMIKPLCDTCDHRSKVSPGRCLAFPQGIPTDILVGKVDHHGPVKGDGGFRYLERK
jgi:hypothetical protein